MANFGTLITMLVIQNVVTAGVALWWMRRVASSSKSAASPSTVALSVKDTLHSFGLSLPDRRLVGLALGLGIMLFVFIQGFEYVQLVLLQRILPMSVYASLKRWSDTTGAGPLFVLLDAPWKKLAFAFVGTLIAPFGEEMFFRGFAYNAIKRRTGITTAIVVSALLFGMAHLNPFALPLICLMGAAFALAYQRTGSLWTSIIMHAVHNGLAFGLMAYQMRYR